MTRVETCFVEEILGGQFQGVAKNDMQIAGSVTRVLVNGQRELLCEHGVNLDGAHLRTGLEQRQSQRPQSGSHFHHALARCDLCGVRDTTDRARINHEVLAELLRRFHADMCSNVLDVGRTEKVKSRRLCHKDPCLTINGHNESPQIL